MFLHLLFFFSSRRRHTRWPRDWSSDVCSSDLIQIVSRLMFPVYSRNSCSLLKGSSYLMIIEQIALTVELMLGSIVLAVLNLLSSLSMQLSDFQALSFLHYLVYDPIFL